MKHARAVRAHSPSGHEPIGVTAVDYNGDGKLDLVVEAINTNIVEGTLVGFVSLDLYTGGGSGGCAICPFSTTTIRPLSVS